MAARDLPSNVEAEAKVVGAMFDYDDDNLALVLTHLGESSEPFFNPQYGIWYDAMVKMYRNGDRIRPESVKLYMEHMKIWESSGGMTMMSHLMSEATISEYIETYSKMILDCHSRRCLIQACKRAGAALYDANVPLEDIRAALESNVFKTASSALSNKWESAEDLVDVEFSRIESISDGKKGEGFLLVGGLGHGSCGVQGAMREVAAGEASAGLAGRPRPVPPPSAAYRLTEALCWAKRACTTCCAALSRSRWASSTSR